MDSQTRSLEFNPDTQQEQENAWSSFAFIWRRKSIVLLVALVGIGLGYLFYIRQVPIYQSGTQILVVDDRPNQQLPLEGVEISSNYDTAHVVLVRSRKVLENAIKKHELERLPTLRGSANPVGILIAGLDADVVAPLITSRTGDIVQLNFESKYREDCPKVLNAIVDAYEDFLGEIHQTVSQETIDLITEAKDQLDAQLSETEAKYRELRLEAPLLFSGQQALNIHEARQQQIESQRTEAVLENSRLKAEIEGLQTAIARGGSKAALTLMITNENEGQRQEKEDSVNQFILPLLVDQELMSEQGLGPDHPKVRALQKRIEMTKKFVLDSEDGEEDVRDFVDIYLESLHQRMQMNLQRIAEMDSLFTKERDSAKLLVKYQVDAETFRAEIDRKSRMFDAVIDRLEEISLVKDSGGASIEQVHPPGLGRQVKPKFETTMVVSALLGLLAGLTLAYVVDTADRRFRSPDEIRTDLGVPVVGHIPIMPTDRKLKKVSDGAGASLAPQLRTVHAPRGRIAEAYRAVRTAVYFSTRGGGHRVVQVTSPSPGDGKTTLAANLAISIANSGKQVLLIDADFRRPRIHRLFGLENEAGMSTVIDHNIELQDAIQTTAVDNLSVLSCGSRPDNPSELLTSKRFDELIGLLREQFELVIVDTPPVLAVTDPLNVGPRVDGVLVVLRLTKSARAAGRRTLDSLEELGANVIGVVVNGVGGGRGAYGNYGYGGYGYNYSRSYGYGGYGYRHGYGDRESYAYGQDDSVYYTDDREPTASKRRKQSSAAH